MSKIIEVLYQKAKKDATKQIVNRLRKDLNTGQTSMLNNNHHVPWNKINGTLTQLEKESDG